MDVFVEVLKTTYRGSKYRKIKVRWWNLGFTGNPWPLSCVETVTIQESDWYRWKLFDPYADIHPGRIYIV